MKEKKYLERDKKLAETLLRYNMSEAIRHLREIHGQPFGEIVLTVNLCSGSYLREGPHLVCRGCHLSASNEPSVQQNNGICNDCLKEEETDGTHTSG